MLLNVLASAKHVNIIFVKIVVAKIVNVKVADVRVMLEKIKKITNL
jgi:hypothetical protein